MIFYDIFFLISAENYFLYLKRKFTTASLTWEMSFTMVFVTVPYIPDLLVILDHGAPLQIRFFV